jgi:hypothetical protein
VELNNLYDKQPNLFEQCDPVVRQYEERFWAQLILKKNIDAEWICQNTWDKLHLTEFFQSCGWSETQIHLAATQIFSRAVYPASELRTCG